MLVALLILLFVGLCWPLNVDVSNDAFIITSFFKGNHSASRMDKQLLWFQNVTLQSVNNAAAFYLERAPYDRTRPDIYYVLNLQGSYAYRALPQEEWAARFPHVKLIYRTGKLNAKKRPQETKVAALFEKHMNGVVSITRLDADDSIALNFFYQLEDLKSGVDFEQEVLLSGSDTLDMLDIGKMNDDSWFYCQYSLHKRPYIMSVGQTVTLLASVWKMAMEARLDFENHTKVAHLIMKLLKKNKFPQTVREVHLTQITGLYLKTDLSSRHEKPVANVTSVPCDRELMQQRIGHGNAEIMWTAVLGAMPELTPQELLENVHHLHMIKMREDAKKKEEETAAKRHVLSPPAAAVSGRR
jgi:hypothetical protein